MHGKPSHFLNSPERKPYSTGMTVVRLQWITWKNCLMSEPILCLPYFTCPFFIHTDACDLRLGVALMQKDDSGRDVAVAFESRTLHKAEMLYSTPEKECLGVIWDILEHFRPYDEGLHVTIYTDHNSLRWLMNRPNPSG